MIVSHILGVALNYHPAGSTKTKYTNHPIVDDEVKYPFIFEISKHKSDMGIYVDGTIAFSPLFGDVFNS